MSPMDLRRLDLNLLLAFEALLAARSVTGAAARLGLRQPAMSAALSRLRAGLGDELFVRVGQGMQPTPRALRLAPGIAAALESLRTTLGPELPFDPAEARRTFVLGITDYALALLGPALVARIRAAGSGLHLRFVTYDKDGLAPMIEGGVLDLAIGVFADPPETAVVTPLFEERFIGIARVGHPALEAELDAAAFADLDHALYTTRRDASGALDAALARRGLARRVAVTVPFVSLLPPLIATSTLVAAMPARAADALLDARIATFPIPLDLRPWTLQMLWSPLARRDNGSAWLREAVLDAARRSPRTP
ncbi:MAG: LysR family transcriptional regulator [Paracoccaceae bacterium]